MRAIPAGLPRRENAMEGAQQNERGRWASLSRIAPHPAGSTASVAAHARRRCHLDGDAEAYFLWTAAISGDQLGRISSEGEPLVRNGVANLHRLAAGMRTFGIAARGGKAT